MDGIGSKVPWSGLPTPFSAPSRLGLSRRRPRRWRRGCWTSSTRSSPSWAPIGSCWSAAGRPAHAGSCRASSRRIARSSATFVGLPIAPDLTFAEAKRADIVIVGDLAVGRDEETRGRWPAAVAWLRLQQSQGALICSVCTGALMLAEAGLLDGEEATCHWAAVDQIKLRYPEVRLRPERFWCRPAWSTGW